MQQGLSVQILLDLCGIACCMYGAGPLWNDSGEGRVTFLDLGREVPVSVPTLVKRNSGFSDSL